MSDKKGFGKKIVSAKPGVTVIAEIVRLSSESEHTYCIRMSEQERTNDHLLPRKSSMVDLQDDGVHT